MHMKIRKYLFALLAGCAAWTALPAQNKLLDSPSRKLQLAEFAISNLYVDKVDEEEALRRMKKIDKERTEYHKYFTGRNWMDMENYDLPINASRIDYDQMIALIKDYLKLRGMID